MSSWPPLQYVTINGANLAYRIVGEETAPLIITVHGGRGLGSHENEFKAYNALSATHRVLSFDQRGHGVSSLTKPFTFAQLVEDIHGLREHFVGDGQVILLGGSFGGFIAQQYAVTYPSFVSHLILRGTAPSHHHEAAAIDVFRTRLHLAPLASVQMMHKIFSSFKDDTEMRLVFFAINILYAEKYDADRGLEDNLKTVYRAETHNELYSEKEKYFDYREQLKHFPAPTLVIVGERDWICPPSQSALIAQLVPNSTLLVVPNANHKVQHDQNSVVLEAVRSFFRKHPATANAKENGSHHGLERPISQ